MSRALSSLLTIIAAVVISALVAWGVGSATVSGAAPVSVEGVAGADGDDGRDGADGETGPAGPAGPAGVQGERGFGGAPGERGLPGPQGERGATGDTGLAGADGATGPAGPQGFAGPVGADGAIGPAGEIGPAGPEGPQGEPGPQGPRGEPSTLYTATVADVALEGTRGNRTVIELTGLPAGTYLSLAGLAWIEAPGAVDGSDVVCFLNSSRNPGFPNAYYGRDADLVQTTGSVISTLVITEQIGDRIFLLCNWAGVGDAGVTIEEVTLTAIPIPTL